MVAAPSHPTSVEEARRLLGDQGAGIGLAETLRGLLADLEAGPPPQERKPVKAVSSGTAGAENDDRDDCEDPCERRAREMLWSLGAHSATVGRLRAHQLLARARFTFERILVAEGGEEALDVLFTLASGFPCAASAPSASSGREDLRACSGYNGTEGVGKDVLGPSRGASESTGAGSSRARSRSDARLAEAGDPGAPDRTPGMMPGRDGTLRGYLHDVIERRDLMALSAVHCSTMPRERGESVEALIVALGLPTLLSRIGDGELTYARLSALLPKTRLLSLGELQLLDSYLVGLPADLSLGRFLTEAERFIASLGARITPAQARRSRHAVLERHGDGTGSLTLHGPLLPLEALYQRAKAVARAILRGRIAALDLHESGFDATCSHMGQKGAGPIGSAFMSADPAEGACEACAPGFDPAAIIPDEDRRFSQLVFDLIAEAQPETTTAVVDDPMLADSQRRHEIRVVCPTTGTWLRRQAAVAVTVPVTTLLGVDERPGVIEGRSPLPAEFAREAAARSSQWFRILTDPATGTVLDEPARSYAPDQATRAVVNTKWQTCTGPGCSAPAQNAEFEHGIPFNHDDPSAGGPTHPSNGHPMCRACHTLKTAGIIRMQRTRSDEIVWTLPLGVTSTTVAPPIDAGGVLTEAVRDQRSLPVRCGQGSRSTLAADTAASIGTPVPISTPALSDTPVPIRDGAPGDKAVLLGRRTAAQVRARFLRELMDQEQARVQVRAAVRLAAQHSRITELRSRGMLPRDRRNGPSPAERIGRDLIDLQTVRNEVRAELRHLRRLLEEAEEHGRGGHRCLEKAASSTTRTLWGRPAFSLLSERKQAQMRAEAGVCEGCRQQREADPQWSRPSSKTPADGWSSSDDPPPF